MVTALLQVPVKADPAVTSKNFIVSVGAAPVILATTVTGVLTGKDAFVAVPLIVKEEIDCGNVPDAMSVGEVELIQTVAVGFEAAL